MFFSTRWAYGGIQSPVSMLQIVVREQNFCRLYVFILFFDRFFSLSFADVRIMSARFEGCFILL